MDEKTLTALQGSIVKWQRVLDGAVENGFRDCPLCDLFFDEENAENCEGCPVAERAGIDCCTRTPYEEWSDYQWEHRDKRRGGNQVFDDRSKAIAQQELDFLRSLVPSSPSAAHDTSKEEK